jgi:hypothetical protein
VGGAGGLSRRRVVGNNLRTSESQKPQALPALARSGSAGSPAAREPLELKRKPEPESLALFWRTAKLQHDSRMVVSRLAAPKALRKPP